jgi:hypothetical protein
VDFSEARDLFVNIFQISDLTENSWTAGKFRKTRGTSLQNLDRGLISQKSRDLFAKFPNNPNNELFSIG